MTEAKIQSYRQRLLALKKRHGAILTDLEEEALRPSGANADGGLSAVPVHPADLAPAEYEEEVALGLYPTGHATVLLPRQIPWVHAHELLLTARPINAARAAAIGLVNAVVEPAALMSTALAAADAIAGNAPLAVRATRAGVRELVALDLEGAYRRQEELGRPLRRSEDAREAQRAFVEKRPPVWKGR